MSPSVIDAPPRIPLRITILIRLRIDQLLTPEEVNSLFLSQGTLLQFQHLHLTKHSTPQILSINMRDGRIAFIGLRPSFVRVAVSWI